MRRGPGRAAPLPHCPVPLSPLTTPLPLALSILGMHLFGCKFSLKTDTGDTVPDRKNFDSLLWAIVTVFQVKHGWGLSPIYTWLERSHSLLECVSWAMRGSSHSRDSDCALGWRARVRSGAELLSQGADSVSQVGLAPYPPTSSQPGVGGPTLPCSSRSSPRKTGMSCSTTAWPPPPPGLPSTLWP